MRNGQTIYGRDWLQDHYAVLEIPRDSTQKQIKSAFRDKIKKYHPDGVFKVGKKLQDMASNETKIIYFAYQTLIDSKKRTTYDKKLENFDPKLISEDGTPKYSIGMRRVDIDFLVGDEKWDEKEQILKKISDISEHDEGLFDLIETQYKKTKNPEEKLKTGYKKLLEKKNIYLKFMEKVIWEEMGIANQSDIKTFYAGEYLNKSKEMIKRGRQEINETLENRILSIASGETPKLITGDLEISQDKDYKDITQTKTKILKKALKSFDLKVLELKNICKERKKVLKELVKFTEWNYFPEKQKIHDKIIVILEQNGKILANHNYEIEGQNVNLIEKSNKIDEIKSIAELKSAKFDKTIKEIIESETNIVLVSKNEQLDNFLQIGYVFKKHILKLKINN